MSPCKYTKLQSFIQNGFEQSTATPNQNGLVGGGGQMALIMDGCRQGQNYNYITIALDKGSQTTRPMLF